MKLKYILLIVCAIVAYGLSYTKGSEVPINIPITAHRGASISYPENTMSAFVEAYNLGADYIELDVQETKDEYIVISHNNNLKKTSGIDKKITESKYDELKNIDVGSHKDERFSDERIPLLEDVIKFAKEKNMKLNIEIKREGRGKNYEQNILDIINKYDYKDMCEISSFDLKIINNIKEIDKTIKCAYIINYDFEDDVNIDNVDAFSIEVKNINKALVDKIHDANKKVYAWVANKKEEIDEMISLSVDNIITDDVAFVKEVLKEYNHK